VPEETRYPVVLLTLPDESFVEGQHTYLGSGLPLEGEEITVETEIAGAEPTSTQARVLAVIPEAAAPIRAVVLVGE
jgi:hypothetical protein